MRFAIFMETYLCSYDCIDTNFTATDDCTDPKTEIQFEIIETQITGIQIYFVMKKVLLFSGKLVCLKLINLLINSRLLQPL